MSINTILTHDAARRALLRGMQRMTRLLSVTLGPSGRPVLNDRMTSSRGPELLDSAGTIARRTVAFEDRFESMGSQMVRDLVRKMNDSTGDGTATAAVLAHRLVDEAARYVAAGGNPMAVNRGLDIALQQAICTLEGQSRLIESVANLASVINGNLHADDITRMISEAVDSVGSDGAIIVENSQELVTRHRYIDGVRWDQGYASSYLLPENAVDLRCNSPRVFVTSYELTSDKQLLPVIEACMHQGERNLFLVAPAVRDSAIALLVLNQKHGNLDNVIAVKAPGRGPNQLGILEDLAATTGARLISKARGDSLADVTVNDLGKASYAWATRFNFGIMGGKGEKRVIRDRIKALRAELAESSNDRHARDRLEERIGQLAGASAVIQVGAPTKLERGELKLKIEAAVSSARAALREGVVPGGGSALLYCADQVKALSLTGDEDVGARILVSALSAPMEKIIENSGVEPGPVLSRIRSSREPLVFDALQLQLVDPWDAGILDPLPVVREALRTAVSIATMAISTEVLISIDRA